MTITEEPKTYTIAETVTVTWAPDEETIVGYPFHTPNPKRRIVVEWVRLHCTRIANTSGRPQWRATPRTVAFRHVRKNGTHGPVVTQDAYSYARDIPGFPAALAAIETHLGDTIPVPLP